MQCFIVSIQLSILFLMKFDIVSLLNMCNFGPSWTTLTITLHDKLNTFLIYCKNVVKPRLKPKNFDHS
jgi:hypothetical protein